MISYNDVIGISDYKTATAPDKLVTYALGSCVGISLFDPGSQIGGLAHIMLPDSTLIHDQSKVDRMKFADTAIDDMFDEMRRKGANPDRVIAKIAGGANMFKTDNNRTLGDIGGRNVQSVKRVLNRLGIPITGEDTGKDYGRTIVFDLDTGKVIVRTIDRETKEI